MLQLRTTTRSCFGIENTNSLVFENITNNQAVFRNGTAVNSPRVIFDVKDLIELGKYLEEVRNKNG